MEIPEEWFEALVDDLKVSHGVNPTRYVNEPTHRELLFEMNSTNVEIVIRIDSDGIPKYSLQFDGVLRSIKVIQAFDESTHDILINDLTSELRKYEKDKAHHQSLKQLFIRLFDIILNPPTDAESLKILNELKQTLIKAQPSI